MPKWCKTIVGILLAPLCVSGTWALWRVARASEHADTIWVATLSGAACWLVVYLLLPKPMWVYVFGHELTHALWTWAMGGRVKRFRASAKGGHVVVTRSNFVIALAPYFFPLYAMVVVLIFAGGDRLWGWQRYVVWFHLLLGAAYAFHVTLTWQILKQHQSDISEQGYLFAGAVIYLGNLLFLLVGIPLLTATVEVGTAFRWWMEGTQELVRRLGVLRY